MYDVYLLSQVISQNKILRATIYIYMAFVFLKYSVWECVYIFLDKTKYYCVDLSASVT
jgi:hypothetical protein